MNKYFGKVVRRLSGVTIAFIIVLVGCSEVAIPNKEAQVSNDAGTLSTLALSADSIPAIEALIDEIQGLALHHGIKNALLKKLQNAIKDLQKGDIAGAIDKMESFKALVNAQSGGKIDSGVATDLIEKAEDVLSGDPCDITRYADPVGANADWTPVECDFVKEAGANSVITTMVVVPSSNSTAAIFIDETEVKQEDYTKCMNDGVCTEPGWYWYGNYDGFFEIDINNPAESIDWYQAKAYCEWRGARLPTEEEWEYAARGPDSLIWPWGDNNPNPNHPDYRPDDPSDLLNYWNQLKKTTFVGSYPLGKSWVGALDMAGNAWEWTDSYYYSFNPNLRVLRGGGFGEDSAGVRAAIRSPRDANSPQGAFFRRLKIH